jgi:hypothetical protein
MISSRHAVASKPAIMDWTGVPVQRTAREVGRRSVLDRFGGPLHHVSRDGYHDHPELSLLLAETSG